MYHQESKHDCATEWQLNSAQGKALG